YRCALTAARVGFFLEQHREEWWVDDERLSLLDPLLPRQPIYLDATRHPGRLASRWNLVVPERMLVPQWAEQDEPQAVDAARVPRFDRRRLAWRDDQRAPALYP
ncbi:MAG: hypothetical protein KC729_17670, partial [Candidatus Eisenbacteria bacterium]|nr:hypothetical protein [Candidatus Eisenbacteria bacterium]